MSSTEKWLQIQHNVFIWKVCEVCLILQLHGQNFTTQTCSVNCHGGERVWRESCCWSYSWHVYTLDTWITLEVGILLSLMIRIGNNSRHANLHIYDTSHVAFALVIFLEWLELTKFFFTCTQDAIEASFTSPDANLHVFASMHRLWISFIHAKFAQIAKFTSVVNTTLASH